MSNRDLDWLAAQQPQRMRTDPAARERALLALVRHATPSRVERGLRIGGLLRHRMFGLGLAGGAAAIAAAALLSTTGGDAGRLGRAVHPMPPAAPRAAVHRPATAGSPLLRLADYVSNSGPPVGDATLVTRTTTTGGNSVTVYDLYADDGQYFFSPTHSGIAGQVSAHHNLAGGLFEREIAAAKLAAAGNVKTAARDMADAPDPRNPISPTQTTDGADRAAIAAKEALTGQAQGGNLYDNWVWENSQDALIAGAGQPQVRAGVLQILATLPGVSVAHGTAGGQPTLVLTAGTPELGPGYAEQLTINADSGVPIRFVGGPPSGPPATTVDYGVARVNLPGLSAAGASSDQ